MGIYSGQNRRSSATGWIKLAILGVVIIVTLQGASCDQEPTESQCRPYIEKALKQKQVNVEEDRSDETPTSAEISNEQEENPPTDELTVSTEDSTPDTTEDVKSEEDGKDTEEDTKSEEQEGSEPGTEDKSEEQGESVEADTKEDDKTAEDTGESGEAKSGEKQETEEKAESEEDGDTVEAEDQTKEESAEETKDEKEESQEGDDTKEDGDSQKEKAEESVEGDTEEKTDTEEGDTKEDDGDTTEDDGDTKEDDGDTKEDDGDTKEDDGDTKEDDGDTKEDDGDTKEDDGDTKEDDNVTKEDDGDSQEEKAEESVEGDTEEKVDTEEGDTKEDDGDTKEDEGDTKEDEGDSKEDDAGTKEQDEGESVEEKAEGDSTEEGASKETQEEEQSKEQAASVENDEGSKEDTPSGEDDQETGEDKDDSGEGTAEDKDDKTEEDNEESEGKSGEESAEAIKQETEEASKEETEEVQADEAESQEKTEKAQTEGAESDETAETEASKEDAEQESTPEEDLTKEMVIPENLRPRDHITKILRLDEDSVETESVLAKAIDSTLKTLKNLYDSAIKPLELLYKYRDLSNRHFGDPEIFSKPLILFMGPWSGGKSSTINYLLDNEFTHMSLRTGAEPSPAYFNILMYGKDEEILDGTQLAADWTFSGLQKFGQGLLDRLRGVKLPNRLLEKVNIVEIPGILEIRKQVQRLFPFNDACQWFIDRADIIFLVYDPAKLDVGPETEAILDQLKGREYQTRIILNKADQVKPEELMRVQGTLIWNISPLMSSTEPPIMYSTSLWSMPYETGAPTRLLLAQERAFLRDLREAVEKRVENKIASARRFAVRVRNHAKMVDCYLTTYYNHKTFFGNRKKISDDIIESPQKYHIYEGLSTLTNISRYDLPDPDVYRDFFKINPLYDFTKLSDTCTYFRGCPINKLDVAIAYDLPELVGKYKKAVELAKEQIQKGNS